MTGKAFFLAGLLALFCCFSVAAATGLGLQGDFSIRSELPSENDIAFTAGASLTIATDMLPWVFALQARSYYIGFAADNWVVYMPLTSALSYVVFWGISGGAELEDAYDINTGARAGLGANLFLFQRHVELYAQAAWNPYFGITLATGESKRFFIKPLSFPVHAGLRFWF